MSAPGAPPVPEGWQASWNAQYNQWFYFHPATGVSQWEYPGAATPPAAPPTAPPAYPPTQAVPAQQSGGGIFGKLSGITSNPNAQTALAVGGSLAAGALLEHEVASFSHHHNIHGPGLGTMAGLLGAAGAGALGTKLFANRQQAQAQQAQVPQAQVPQAAYPGLPSVPPPVAGYPAAVPTPPVVPGYGVATPPGPPGAPAFPGPPGAPVPQQPTPAQAGGGGIGKLGGMAAGAGIGIAGALAATEASHLLHQHRDADAAAKDGSRPSLGSGIMKKFQNANKPRLIIHAATFAGEDVTQKMQLLVQDDQSINISGGEMFDQFGDPWPNSGQYRELIVLYQYGDRPMEVLAGTSSWSAFQIEHESLSTERMKFVNPPPSPIICLVWGTENCLNEIRAEKLEKEGELEAKDLGSCGHYVGVKALEAMPVLVCFYRTHFGGVGIGHARSGGTLRLPWNPLAKWG